MKHLVISAALLTEWQRFSIFTCRAAHFLPQQVLGKNSSGSAYKKLQSVAWRNPYLPIFWATLVLQLGAVSKMEHCKALAVIQWDAAKLQ